MVYAIVFIFLGTMIATILGALFGTFAKKLNKELITLLVNFALGAMISLIFLELFQESLHHTIEGFTSSKGGAIAITLSIIFVSGFLFYLLHEGLHHLTHHHSEDHDDLQPCHDHAHSTEIFEHENSLVYASFIFLIAIFIHNIPEGLALGISFTDVEANGLPLNGIITACILLIHNFIIGFTMCTSFIQAKKSNKFAILMTTLSSVPAVALGLTGYFVSAFFINNINPASLDLFKGIMLSISTGSLIYVLIVELMPQSFVEYKSKYTFIYIILGIVLNTLLMNLGVFF